MHIGICGPLLLESVKRFLGDSYDSSSLEGMAGGAMVGVLAQGLLERGNSVVVFTQQLGLEREQIVQGPPVGNGRLKVCVVPCRLKLRPRILDMHRVERAGLRRAIMRERPDILHAHWTYEYALAALESGLPTLVTPRDWAPYILRVQRGWKARVSNLMKLWLNHLTLRRARYLSVCSPYMQEMFRRRGRQSIRLIPNCVEDSLLNSEQRCRAGAPPLLISINRYFDPRKNIVSLLRAFPLIRQQVPSCELALPGEQHEVGGPVEQWAKSQGLTQGVRFIGRIPHAEVFMLVDQASALVHPALEESFGNVLIEAMARRTPVVGGARSGAVPWILDQGKAGMLCDVLNPGQIAASCLALLQDSDLWTRMSEAGWRRVKEKFTLSRVTDEYLDEYARILREEGKAV